MQYFERQNQLNLEKFAEMEPLMKPIRLAQLHSLAQVNTNHFRVDGLKLTYTSQNSLTQYIFNMPIRHNESTKFKLKIVRAPSRYIMVGVVDYTREKDERYSLSSANSMCYFGLYQ